MVTDAIEGVAAYGLVIPGEQPAVYSKHAVQLYDVAPGVSVRKV